jgi:hypothetical protein
MDDILSTMTKEQIELCEKSGDDIFKITEIIKEQTFESTKIGAVLKDKGNLTNNVQSKVLTFTDTTTGHLKTIEVPVNSVKKGTNISGIDEKIYGVKGFKDVQTIEVTIPTASGSVTRIRAVPYTKQINTSSRNALGTVDLASDFAKKNPDGYLRYVDLAGDVKTMPASYFTKDGFKGNPTTLESFSSKMDSIENLLLKEGASVDEAKALMKANAIDKMDAVYDVVENVPKKIEDNAKAIDSVATAFENKQMAGVRGNNFINQQTKVLTGKAYFNNFLLKPLPYFGANFLYWEIRSGGATFNALFGDALDTKRLSMYRLPETYSAMHIKHGETPNIYKDAYIDFFANDGSDQGDLFMAFLDSVAFWTPYIIKQSVDLIPGAVAKSISQKTDDLLNGKIKRNKVDDIVLFTDTINTGCGTSCTITLDNSNYLEKVTRQKTLANQKAEDAPGYIDPNASKSQEKLKQEMVDQKLQDKYQQMDYAMDQLEGGLKSFDTDQKEIDYITENYSKNYKQTIDNTIPQIEENANNYVDGITDDISISFSVPSGIMIQNYILENTSKDNLEDKGQNLISFTHHTDYDGTTGNETSKDNINLVTARNQENTCEQKIDNLNVIGIPIGKVLPNNYRAAAVMVIQEHLSYITMPAYKNTWVLGALTSSVPQQTLIMPEIYGCVDDQEGRYNHFFVSTRADDEIAESQKNKVGEMVEDSLDNIGDSLGEISKGTDFEKTVKTGTNEAKKFIENNIKEYPIVQSRLVTNGEANGSLNGQLFFIELGPNTNCNANALSDTGVEFLKDKTLNESLKIDKENGEMSLINEDGTVNIIIDKDNSDFVRLIGTNLGIPAKVIPHSLSYIPVPDTNSELFEVDVYGNFTVLDGDFLDCLKAGYEAQTGLVMESGVTNLKDYFGNVKNVNILNPLTQYNVYPQNNKIVAEGTPRLVANNKSAILKINGKRKSNLTHINNEQKYLGRNISIQFENAQLIYSGEKDSYIMWVQHTTVTSSNDIKSLDTTLVKEKANNGCDEEEIALDFKVKPSNTNDDSQTVANVEKLNKAFENIGPFKMFDTATKTFIFYISEPPECEQRLKIIDKETGEIFDQKITDIQETANGIKIKTEDGSEHEFEFSADNGIPELKYNGERETLLSAQGNNGSFWYDPQTGNWYTENGHLIPFDSEFKDGMMFSANENGEVTGKSAQNVFNIGDSGSGGSNSGFNIPLTPSSFVNLILYISIILFAFMLINYKIKKIKPKNIKKKR